MVFRQFDGSPCSQGLFLSVVVELNAVLLRSQVLFYLVSEIVHGQYGRGDACIGEAFKYMVDDGFAGEGKQALWPGYARVAYRFPIILIVLKDDRTKERLG